MEHFKKTGIEEVSGSFVYLKQVNSVSSVSQGSFIGIRCLFVFCHSLFSTKETLISSSISLSCQPVVFSHPQPYYATRVNAADIENRVHELNKKSLSEETSKAGFWEEFDVRNSGGIYSVFLGSSCAPFNYPSLISFWKFLRQSCKLISICL